MEHMLGGKQQLSEVNAVANGHDFVDEVADGRQIPQVVPAIIELEDLAHGSWIDRSRLPGNEESSILLVAVEVALLLRSVLQVHPEHENRIPEQHSDRLLHLLEVVDPQISGDLTLLESVGVVSQCIAVHWLKRFPHPWGHGTYDRPPNVSQEVPVRGEQPVFVSRTKTDRFAVVMAFNAVGSETGHEEPGQLLVRASVVIQLALELVDVTLHRLKNGAGLDVSLNFVQQRVLSQLTFQARHCLELVGIRHTSTPPSMRVGSHGQDFSDRGF